MRLIPEVGEYYHIFNRGVDKRNIFLEEKDIRRFLESFVMFNVKDPIGSIFEASFKEKLLGNLTSKQDKRPLVEIICYCLNPNHFHFVFKQLDENGIQKIMQRIGTGYTNYFNEKNRRSGALFQGSYKAVHIASNKQLLHTSIYVNLNNQLGSLTPKLSQSSWLEYCDKKDKIGGSVGIKCKTDVILGQFKAKRDFQKFVESTKELIIEKKEAEKEMQWLLGS